MTLSIPKAAAGALRAEEPIGLRKPVRVLNLICLRGHIWESEVVAINWDGAYFAERFCPKCGLGGKRVPITAEDCQGLITEDDCRQIGEDAMPVFGAILMYLMALPAGEERSYTLTLNQVCSDVLEHAARVLKAIQRLQFFDYLVVEERPEGKTAQGAKYAENALERQFRFELGKKVKLIKLTDGAY